MSLITSPHIKHLKLTALFLVLPFYFFAQPLTGLWTGALSNDSNTIRKDQSFEIALTEYRGRVYGYSRSEFIVNDTLYYILKRVKGTIQGDLCEVTDDDIISYNFRGKLDKGIKVTSTFRRNQADSTWYLDGTWKTNATRKYYAVTGKVGLQEEKDLNASKLFPHLEELSLANDVAFYKEFKESKEEPIIVKIAHPEKVKTEYSDRARPVINNNDIVVAPLKPNLQKTETLPVPVSANETDVAVEATEPVVTTHPEKIAMADLPKHDIKNIPASTVSVVPAQVNKLIAGAKKPDAVPTSGSNISSTTNPVAEKKEIIQENPVQPVKSELTSKTEVKQENTVVKTQPKLTAQPDLKTNATTVALPVTKNTASKEVETKKPVVTTSSAQPNIVAGTNSFPVNKEIKTVPLTASVKPENKKTVISAPAIQPKSVDSISTASVNKEIITEPLTVSIKPENKKTETDIIGKASMIEGRKSEFTQIVNFKADSLELSLYDNGEIDGDTVSVFMNGEVLMSRQGLKATAIKKTIHIIPGNEDFTLVLFAENLGKYPPNTGLLVVHDGEDVYNLRFSSDFQKNAGIVFRRKK